MLLIIFKGSNLLIINRIARRKIVTFFTPLSRRSMRKSTLHTPHAYLHKKGQGGQKVGWFYSKKLLLDKK